MWVEVDVEECWNKKGRGPIGVRWFDVDKGFGVYRSRLVAKGFKPKSKVNDQEGLFVGTSLLELVKMCKEYTSNYKLQKIGYENCISTA